MVQPSSEAPRPASSNEDAHTSSAERRLKLSDGRLSCTVFAKTRGKDKVHLFVIPERAYRDDEKKGWKNTHLLHEEDLLPMAALLTRTYHELRHKQQGAS
ncbi:MAG: hypothetical protein KDA93_24395 [Planctomycetaceae bacterium]|nr:hypothetical protein [Planctomycetaceae bacterium]